MEKFVKIIALLGVMVLAACGGKVQSTYGTAQLQNGDQIRLGRLTVPDREGVTTLKTVEVNGRVIEATMVDEGTTTAQDYGQTLVGAILPGAINGAIALEIESRQSKRCADGQCGGGSQTVVQVGTNVQTGVNLNGGCSTCGLLNKE